jgi:hypothetical protein
MQQWFLELMAVSNQPSEQIDDEVGRASLMRVLDL